MGFFPKLLCLPSSPRKPPPLIRGPGFRFPGLLSRIVLFDYRIMEHLATGGTAEIYAARSVERGAFVAVKVSPRHQFREVRAYILLLDDPAPVGIPKLISYGRSSDDHTVMVTQLLDSSINDIALLMGGKIGVKSVCMLAIQLIRRIEYIHSKGLIHGDINPGNVVMGKRTMVERSVAYLIDFEDSQRYRDHNGIHVPQTTDNIQRGNFCYVSTNCHAGMRLSRRDDLISLGYTLVKLAKGYLPWEKSIDQLVDLGEVVRLKKSMGSEEICDGLPIDFIAYLNVVQELEFTENPGYDGLIWLFKTCLEDNNEIDDGVYEWFSYAEFLVA